MSSTIYCFSGLGADEKLFENLSLPGYTLQHIHWLPPLQQETLPHYAQRLAAQIKEPNPLLLGVSFGGMLAVEVAKMLNAKQTILISSIQSATQLPAFYHWANGIKMTTWLPAQLFKTPGPAADFLFGTETAADKKLLRYFIRHADAAFIKWALQAIINWKNKSLPANLIHIHGSSDRIIPIPKNVQHVIKGSGHLMIYNRADTINKLLEEILPT